MKRSSYYLLCLFVTFFTNMSFAADNQSSKTRSIDLLKQTADQERAQPQMAYIANHDSSDKLTLCTVNSVDGSLSACQTLTDPSFNYPIDVVVTSDLTMAFVANSEPTGGVYYLSVCPLSPDGTIYGACIPVAIPGIDLEYTGLALSPDDKQLVITNGENNTITVCDTQTLVCVPGSSPYLDIPHGRVAITDIVYVGNYGSAIEPIDEGSVLVCESFTDCVPDFDPSFSNPLGVALNPSATYLYAANLNNTVSICKVEGGILNLCRTSTGVDNTNTPTFDFSANTAVNFFMNNNGVVTYAYLPIEASGTDGTISICPLDRANGAIGVCKTQNLPNTSDPSSVWITNPALAEPVTEYLYVGNRGALSDSCGVSKQTKDDCTLIQVFNTNDLTTPIVTIEGNPGDSAYGFAFDPNGGYVYVPNPSFPPAHPANGFVNAYSLPLNDSSTPASSFSSPGASAVDFGPDGYLYVADYYNSLIYAYDTSDFSTPVLTLDVGNDLVDYPYQIVFDNEGNLIVADWNLISVFEAGYSDGDSPSFTVPESDAVVALAIKPFANQLYAGTLGATGDILVYDLPLTDTSIPDLAETITVSGGGWINFAFDAALNLYGSDYDLSEIDVFAPQPTPPPSYMSYIPYPLGYKPAGLAIQSVE